MVLTAMLVGLAGALMSLEFSLPMMPPKVVTVGTNTDYVGELANL